MPGPLDGVRVLEFSVIYAGPFGGLHLSDFGAEVIKVEAPGGEPFRHQGAVVPGESKAFHWLNRGKQSLVLDLSDPRGQEVIHRLIVDTDVVLINYRPGVPERLGIDYETLSAIKPDLVYADITAFGTEGPLADRAGSDIVAQAYSGLIALDGKTDEHGSPESVAFAAGDCTTGAASVMGILAALFHRERTGEGQIIRAQLLRSVMSFTGISSMREPASDFAGSDRTRDATNQARDAGGSYDDIIEARRELGKELRAAFGIYYAGYRVKDGGMVLGRAHARQPRRLPQGARHRGRPQRRPGLRRARPGEHQGRAGAEGARAEADAHEDRRRMDRRVRGGGRPGGAGELPGGPGGRRAGRRDDGRAGA